MLHYFAEIYGSWDSQRWNWNWNVTLRRNILLVLHAAICQNSLTVHTVTSTADICNSTRIFEIFFMFHYGLDGYTVKTRL